MLKDYADDEDPPIVLIMLVTLAVVGFRRCRCSCRSISGGQLQVPQVVLGGCLGGARLVRGPHDGRAPLRLRVLRDPGGTDRQAAAAEQSAASSGREGDRPNGVAFLYISYQIGAALQISDVPVTSNKMRALIIGQTVFAFFYNTMLVAAGVNIVVLAASAK